MDYTTPKWTRRPRVGPYEIIGVDDVFVIIHDTRNNAIVALHIEESKHWQMFFSSESVSLERLPDSFGIHVAIADLMDGEVPMPVPDDRVAHYRTFL